MFKDYYYKEFKVAFLANKFWTNTSILVPNREVYKDDFIDVKDILRTTAGRDKIRPQGLIKGIAGEVLLPGEGNYCFIDGDYFHLEKTTSEGVMKDGDYEEEGFFYTIIWDDGMSVYIRNEVYLEGTINKTGDPELVRANIAQTTPLISNVNGFKLMNGIRTQGRPKLVFKQADPKKFNISNQLSNHDYGILKDALSKIELGPPNEDKLVLPLVYKSTTSGDGRWNILRTIEKFSKKDLSVYDVSEFTPRGVFEGVLNTTEVYSVTSRENITFTYAKTVNPTKYVDLIDLSNCTDIRELSNETLNHKYSYIEGADNPVPKFSLRKFIDDLFVKLKLNSLKAKEIKKQNLIDIASEEISKALGSIITQDDSEGFRRANIFKNVELEPIERTVHNINNDRVNSKGYEIFKYRFPYLKFHKNFIFDDASSLHKSMITLKEGVFQGEEGERILEELKRKAETNDIEEFNKLIKEEIPKYFEVTTPLEGYKDCNFIHFPHKYKMTCEGCEDQLDGSRGASYNDRIIALIPDYKRKTHVLAVSQYIDTDLKWDEADSQIYEHGRVKLVVFNEVQELISNTSDEFKNPSDFMSEYSRNNSLYPFQYGYAFSHLIFKDYYIQYKHYYSQCEGYNYCLADNGRSPKNASPNRKASKYEVLVNHDIYVEDGKNYPFQFTFPVQTEHHNIVKLLEGYSHLPDDVLKGEVINSTEVPKKRKGVIKRYSQRIDEDLKVGYHTKESQKLIPKDTVVAIWMDFVGEGRYENINRPDHEGTYKKVTGSHWAEAELLLGRLYILGFLVQGNDSTRGGIPNGIANETVLSGTKGPNGESILRFTGVKPYRGYYYTATVKFLSIDLTRNGNYILGLRFNEGDRYFDHQNRKDWFIAIVPNPYEDEQERFKADAVIPEYSYRELATNVTRRAILAFLFNGYFRPYTFSGRPFMNNYVDSGLETNVLNFYPGSYYRKGQNYRTQRQYYVIEDKPFSGDGAGANSGNNFFKRILANENTILGTDYVKYKALKSDRTSNPKNIRAEYKLAGDILKVNNIDDEIPPFMVKFFNLNDPALCEPFHGGVRNENIDAEVFATTLESQFREKIKKLCHNIRIFLSTNNHIFELTGTKWIASVKLNLTGPNLEGTFELFTKDRLLIKDAEEEKWEFENDVENDIDALINTQFELNIHGKRIPLKSRFIAAEERLDIGLYIRPIHDPRQSEMAAYYKITLLNDEIQDTIGTTLEVPKEEAKHEGLSVYEKEILMRQIAISEAERQAERALLDLRIRDFKMGDRYEKWENDLNLGYGSASNGVGAAVTAGQSFASAYTGRQHRIMGLQARSSAISNIMKAEEAGKPPRPGDLATQNRPILGLGTMMAAAFGGIGAVVLAAIEQARLASFYTMKEAQRVERFALGMEKFHINGELMSTKHIEQEGLDYTQIAIMSNNIVYPQTTNLLIYKQINKTYSLEDVFMMKYFPKGPLFEFIKRGYYEYGYEILVRNFVCTGINTIKRHLRFATVETNLFHNQMKRQIIEQRALRGIKVVEGQ